MPRQYDPLDQTLMPLSVDMPGLVRPRYPIGLPPGSVRALITFMLLGTFWTLLLMPREKGAVIPLYLYYLVFLVIGCYFGARGGAPRLSGEWSPLFLPRGSIRFLIMLGFGLVLGFGWYRDPDFFKKITLESVTDRPFLPFIITGAFFLGSVIAWIASALLSGPRGLPGWYQDIQAWLALLAMIGLGFEIIYQLIIRPGLNEPPFDLPEWQAILSSIVAFYFGARS